MDLWGTVTSKSDIFSNRSVLLFKEKAMSDQQLPSYRE